MADFPAKRRKTGESSSAVPLDDNNATPSAVNRNSRPSISYRQSFQSPTRSSLARSNPEVLSHVLSRSPIKSPIRRPAQRESGFGLRDKKAIRPSLTGLDGASSSAQHALNMFPGISPRRASGAFAVPPRRVSRAATAAAETPLKEKSPAATRPQPSKEDVTTTPRKELDPDEQLASELDSATRELENSGLLRPSPLPEDYVEPELPPTPTQLGLEKKPETTRDLLRSPSAGRGRRKPPLGPSGLAEAVDLDLDADVPDVPERNQDNLQVPEIVRKKEEQKNELVSQLDQLKADVAQLEQWALQAKQGTDGSQLDQDAVAKLITLLGSNDTTYDPLSQLLAPEKPPFSALISSLLPFSKKSIPARKDTTSSDPTNAFALKKTDDSKRYLTVFAPLDLTYSSKLSVPSDSAPAVTETHEITISAQPPFPRHIFSIPLTFTTELQSERMLSISLKKPRSAQSKIPPGIQAWIKSRLASPLLKLDISGLCTGVGHFWEASVCRARMWSALQRRSELLSQNKDPAAVDERSTSNLLSLSEPISKSTLRSLIPHLQRSSMLFISGPKKHESRSILLSCPLELDYWTGEAQLKPDISIHAPDLVRSKINKAERDMKQLFHSLLKTGVSDIDNIAGAGPSGDAGGRHIESVVKATEGVIALFFGLDSLPKGE